MTTKAKPQRPVFFNLIQIQMPVGSITSILHRVTGVLLAIGLPLSLYLLQFSLQGLQVLAGAQQRMAGQLRRGCLRVAQPVGNVLSQNAFQLACLAGAAIHRCLHAALQPFPAILSRQ